MTPDTKTLISINATTDNKLSLTIDYEALSSMAPDALYVVLGSLQRIQFRTMAILEGVEADARDQNKNEITDQDIDKLLGDQPI